MLASRSLLAATMVLALASCGDVQWRKANGDDSMLSQDLTACRKLAMERTVRSGNSVPRTEISPVFGPTGAAPADVRMQETQAVTVCMREKGYALVPVSAPR
jgi:hypothetical protein